MFFQLVVLFMQAVCLITLILIGWYVYLHTSQFYRAANRIPGPRALPFLGNALDLMGAGDVFIKVIHTKWVKEFGEIFRLFVGKGCYVVISSSELVEPLLKSQKYIEKGLSYDLLIPWIGRGLLTNYGESWKTRRRLLTPAFHFDILKNFIEIFNEQSRVLTNALIKWSQNNEAKPIEISSLTARCTLDIICEAAMGTKIDAQLHDTAYSKSIHRVGEIFTEQFQKPWLLNPSILSISSLGRDQRRVLKIANDFSDKVINDRKEYLQNTNQDLMREDHALNSKKKRMALLDLLLTVCDDGQQLSHEEIRSEINTFMFAGHDTTSSLVSWFLYLMAANPEHQAKVREELFDVIGDSERNCTQDDLANLKYLECCIKETLRLYPSAPVFERMAIDDVKLGNYMIPAGCSILVSVYAMHRNEKYFDDPLAFNPERFFPEESDRRHPFCYIPFSAGPRNCIGQRFAMNEARVILAYLLRNLEFEVSPDCASPTPAVLLTLKSLTGINLIVKPIKK